MKFSKDLLKGNIMMIVLGSIRQEEKYGYEIIKELQDSSGGLFEMKEGTLYPILHTLEYEGYVVSRERTAKNGRKRKYYRLTKNGLKLLFEKKKEWSSFKLFLDQLVARTAVYG